MDKQSNKKKKVKKAEVVTNCDRFKEVVANCDQLPQVINHDLANINIESLIRIIRGQKVMLDSDLAMLYGVETRSLNQAVRRNLKRFPDDFMFQLTKEEWNVLRSQIVTLEDSKSQIATSRIVLPIVCYRCHRHRMACGNAIADAYLAKFVEESIKVGIICKTLHQTDTERAVHSTHLDGKSIRCINLCVHFTDILLCSTQVGLADIADTG